MSCLWLFLSCKSWVKYLWQRPYGPQKPIFSLPGPLLRNVLIPEINKPLVELQKKRCECKRKEKKRYTTRIKKEHACNAEEMLNITLKINLNVSFFKKKLRYFVSNQLFCFSAISFQNSDFYYILTFCLSTAFMSLLCPLLEPGASDPYSSLFTLSSLLSEAK